VLRPTRPGGPRPRAARLVPRPWRCWSLVSTAWAEFCGTAVVSVSLAPLGAMRCCLLPARQHERRAAVAFGGLAVGMGRFAISVSAAGCSAAHLKWHCSAAVRPNSRSATPNRRESTAEGACFVMAILALHGGRRDPARSLLAGVGAGIATFDGLALGGWLSQSRRHRRSVLAGSPDRVAGVRSKPHAPVPTRRS